MASLDELEGRLSRLEAEVHLLKAEALRPSPDGAVTARCFRIVDDQQTTLAEMASRDRNGAYLRFLDQNGKVIIYIAVSHALRTEPTAESSIGVLNIGDTISIEVTDWLSAIRVLGKPVPIPGQETATQQIVKLEFTVDHIDGEVSAKAIAGL